MQKKVDVATASEGPESATSIKRSAMASRTVRVVRVMRTMDLMVMVIVIPFYDEIVEMVFLINENNVTVIFLAPVCLVVLFRLNIKLMSIVIQMVFLLQSVK